MTFISMKTGSDGTVYQIVRCTREGGEVRLTVLASLGSCDTIAAALAAARQCLLDSRRWAHIYHIRATRPQRLGEASKQAHNAREAEKCRRSAEDLLALVAALERLQAETGLA